MNRPNIQPGECCFRAQRQGRGRQAVQGGVQGDDDEGEEPAEQEQCWGEEEGQGKGEKDLRTEYWANFFGGHVSNFVFLPECFL